MQKKTWMAFARYVKHLFLLLMIGLFFIHIVATGIRIGTAPLVQELQRMGETIEDLDITFQLGTEEDAVDRNRFKIGSWVGVRKYAWRDDSSGRRTISTTEYRTPRVGQVVGAIRLSLGRLGWDDDNGIIFEASGTVPAWLVRFGMTNKVVPVLSEDLEAVPEPPEPLKWRFADRPEWTEACRAMLRAEVASMRRESNGRWKADTPSK